MTAATTSLNGECQSSGGQTTISDAPWSSLPSAERRNRLTRAVADHPEGRCLSALVEDVFGEFDFEGGDYRLALRHYSNHEEYFKISRSSTLVWIYPRPALYNSLLDTASKHTVETQDGDGVAMSNARAMLRRRQTFSGPDEKGELVGAFGAKREATEGRYHVYRDSFDSDERLVIPYSTRFNSLRRVEEIAERYDTAWNRAAERYDKGVVFTGSTDPSRYDNIEDMAETLLEDVNRLKDWLSRSPENGPPRPDHRPPSIVVPEFTSDGKPHIHVVFFGVDWLSTHDALSRYWSESRGRAEVVWVDRIETLGRRWVWKQSPEDRMHDETQGCSPRQYLRESIRIHERSVSASAAGIQEIANVLRATDDEDVEDANTNENRARETQERAERLWKAALYWATELPACTVSPSLKPDKDHEDSTLSRAPDGTPLPDDAPARWVYAGAARYDEIPGYLRHNAIIIARRGDEESSISGPGPPL